MPFGFTGGGGGGSGQFSQIFSGVVQGDPGGASACTLAGALAGDVLIQAIDLTGVVDANTFFEAVVTVNGQLQQLAGFAGANLLTPVLIGRP